MAEGGCESSSGESRATEAKVNEGMDRELKARSETRNSNEPSHQLVRVKTDSDATYQCRHLVITRRWSLPG